MLYLGFWRQLNKKVNQDKRLQMKQALKTVREAARSNANMMLLKKEAKL